MRPPYAIPNQRVAFHAAESPLRQGSYRALAATANHFARETHMDEIAHAARAWTRWRSACSNLDDARLRAVLEAAAERFGWGTRRRRRATAAASPAAPRRAATSPPAPRWRWTRRAAQVRVVRVVEAFECGAIVNPDGLRNQVEGAVVQALGGALFEQIDFADGTILTDRFSRYRVPRFADVPPIETVLLDRPDLPSAGAGETPIVGLAPALGNAIFAATGQRLRALPPHAGGHAPPLNRRPRPDAR